MLEYFNKATDNISYLIRNNVDMQKRMASVDRVYALLEEDDEKSGENFKFAKYNATDDDIEKACEYANIYAFNLDRWYFF